jgi:hypothetical protein
MSVTSTSSADAPRRSPTESEIASARDALRAAGFSDADMAIVTGLGLRRLPNCPPEASILVKVAAGALSVHGASRVLEGVR